MASKQKGTLSLSVSLQAEQRLALTPGNTVAGDEYVNFNSQEKLFPSLPLWLQFGRGGRGRSEIARDVNLFIIVGGTFSNNFYLDNW